MCDTALIANKDEFLVCYGSDTVLLASKNSRVFINGLQWQYFIDICMVLICFVISQNIVINSVVSLLMANSAGECQPVKAASFHSPWTTQS